MKRASYIFMLIAMAVVSSCVAKSDLEKLQGQIDDLQGGKIASIEQQISNIQVSITSLQTLGTQLSSLVATLQTDVTGMKSDLISKEKALNDKIEELKKYIDSEIAGTKDWTSATFATLTQYQAVLGELESIKQSISDLDTNLRAEIEKAISESESSMKGWVNEQLTGYYTIAQMEAKLKALTDADSANEQAISKVAADLETAKTELTEAYTKAIADAITKYDGEITSKIAADIKAATDALQKQIDALDVRVTALEGMIQSVIIIPAYSDGSVMCSTSGVLTLNCIITPSSAVKGLTKENFKLYATSVLTKATSPSVVNVTSAVVHSATGTVDIKADIKNLLDNLSEKENLSVSLFVKSGNSELMSSFVNVSLKDGSQPEAKDLSANGTANSYIVTEEGYYSIKTVKGNTSTSVGVAASTEVLWESFGTSTTPSEGDLVYDATYSDGRISFSASSLKGNAVIAAKDASGNILWSWHIWLTDQPVDQIYNNNAGTMMDRNLGATSATPGDVHALGLLYQWGRKDPFLSGQSISSNTKAASTATWPAPVLSNPSNGTIAYAIAHPTTFILQDLTYKADNYDWYYTGSTSTDNTRWQTSDKAKGLYDPCPAGYRVPDGGSNGVWAKALGTSQYWGTSSNWDATNRGMDYGKTDKKLGSGTIWYPAAGYLDGGDGSLGDVGYGGQCWSCTPDSPHAYSMGFDYDGYVYQSDLWYRAYGQSVRCVKQ